MLGPDLEGDVWLPEWPVLFVSCGCAEAYARWRGARDKLPTRLLIELEWEKAGRGGDGRVYPWGDWLDPTYCCMRQSRLTRELPAMMCEFPVDESPYGVRHLAGNVEEWLGDPWRPAGPLVGPDGRALPSPVAEGAGSRGETTTCPTTARRCAAFAWGGACLERRATRYSGTLNPASSTRWARRARSRRASSTRRLARRSATFTSRTSSTASSSASTRRTELAQPPQVMPSTVRLTTADIDAPGALTLIAGGDQFRTCWLRLSAMMATSPQKCFHETLSSRSPPK